MDMLPPVLAEPVTDKAEPIRRAHRMLRELPSVRKSNADMPPLPTRPMERTLKVEPT
jgi:hypothetical protein